MALKKPKTKQAFIELESATWLALTLPTVALPDAAWTQPGAAGDWSLKDVWAHIAAWMKETHRIMPLLLKGEKVPANIPAFNREQDARNRTLTLEQARQRLARERKRILALVAKMPEAHLLDNPRVYSWVSYTTYNHYAEHIPNVVRFARSMKRKMKRQGAARP